MKILTNAYSLQPDGYEPDETPAVCVCGHEQPWHEAIGACWWNEGACEVDGCPCGQFSEYDEEGE